MQKRNGVVDKIELDEAAQREFDALNTYLAELVPHPEPISEETRGRLLQALNEDAQIARWRLRLHGAHNLAAAAAFRERVVGEPWGISARVTYISSGSIEFSLATMNRVTAEEVTQAVLTLATEFNCGTTVDVIPLTSDWSR